MEIITLPTYRLYCTGVPILQKGKLGKVDEMGVDVGKAPYNVQWYLVSAGHFYQGPCQVAVAGNLE